MEKKQQFDNFKEKQNDEKGSTFRQLESNTI